MNILHLSDIHFGRNDPAYGLSDPFARHDQILDELIDTVRALDPVLRPEHIVFTGDIAWHGKRTEFSEAYEWFSRLLDALQLTGKDISFCVGNHDVDWGYRCINTKLDDNALEQIGTLYRYENVHLLEPSIYAYDEFCRRIGMVPYAYPVNGKKEYSYSVGYKDVPFACGKTVRLISLNTSLLIAQPGISEDKMWLGQEQLKSLIEYGILPSDESVWYTIMLYHHSDRFLHPNETSTYNGRCATLPMMMSYADLLLCGHTESSGRPRLTKQLGGGMLLSAGAAYYSDEHHNAFSMLYLSDEKRTAGFLPYVYDGSWRDYDFEQPELDAVHCRDLPRDGETLCKASLVLSAGGETYTVAMDTLNVLRGENGDITVDNRMDFMNYFSLSASGKPGSTVLSLTLGENWRRYLRAHTAWREYAAFLRRAGGNASWRLLTQEGETLLSGSGLPQSEELTFDETLEKKLRQIEFYFDVRFTLPETVSEGDLRKITLLTELAEQDYTDRALTTAELTRGADRAMLAALDEKKAMPLYLSGHERCAVSLFGVSIDFGEITVLAGPYRADAQDVRRKLETYCDGDTRSIRFTASEGAKTYLIRDMGAFLCAYGKTLRCETLDFGALPLTLEL